MPLTTAQEVDWPAKIDVTDSPEVKIDGKWILVAENFLTTHATGPNGFCALLKKVNVSHANIYNEKMRNTAILDDDGSLTSTAVRDVVLAEVVCR